MNFSGNSSVSAFSFDFADLLVFGLVYHLNGGPLGDGTAEGILAMNTSYSYWTGQGPLGIEGGYVESVWPASILSSTSNMVTPIPNPEPTTILLFGIGLLGLAGASRKKQ